MAQKIDISGKRFGWLIVLGDSGKRTSNKKILWHCLCDCGNTCDLSKDRLMKDVVPSCGCQNQKKAIHIGDRFGKLTVVETLGSVNGDVVWKCMCDCGKEHNVTTKALNFGQVKSCGCLKHEAGILKRKYNKRDRKLYFRWLNIRERCYNPNNPAYKNYGGRGIKMCAEWKADFYAFRDWAIENGYNDFLSIDRIDNDKDYSPDNCRWTTVKVQSNNRRSNRFIEIDGIKKTLSEWCNEYNIKYSTVQKRLYKYGWTEYDAVTTPARKKLPNGYGLRYKEH